MKLITFTSSLSEGGKIEVVPSHISSFKTDDYDKSGGSVIHTISGHLYVKENLEMVKKLVEDSNESWWGQMKKKFA